MNKSFLSEIIIVILIAIILWQHSCTGGKNSPCPEADTVTTVQYIHDTLVHEIKIPQPFPVAYEINEVPLDVDTHAILQAYYTGMVYEDTYSDTDINIHLMEAVAENKIQWRKFRYQILRPQEIITTTTITPPAEQRAKLFIGARMGGTKTELTTISPEIIFVSKKDNAVSIGYNLHAKAVELGAYWKISLRKKDASR